jgi:hypothetical protein
VGVSERIAPSFIVSKVFSEISAISLNVFSLTRTILTMLTSSGREKERVFILDMPFL